VTQLRADVAVRLLLSGCCPPAEGSSRPGCISMAPALGEGITAQVVITVPALSLLGADTAPADLQGYGPIPAEVAARLTAEAPSFARLLTDPVTSAPLALDRTTYRLTAAQRRWLAAVHPECTFFGCLRSTRNCDSGHTASWARDHGSTDVENLKPRCRGHHRLKSVGLWPAVQPPGELPATEWTSPAGRVYRDEPEPLAATGPEALSTPLQRLEIRDLDRWLKVAYERRRNRLRQPGGGAGGGTADSGPQSAVDPPPF
jgi:hypothetical protein